MTLKELRDALKKAHEKMKAARKALAEAAKDSSESGDEDREKAEKAYTDAKAEAEAATQALKDGIEAAKEDKAVSGLLDEADGLTETVVPKGAGLAGDPDDPANDNSKSHQPPSGKAEDKDRTESDIFFKYMTKKKLSDREIDRMQPENKKLVEEVDADFAIKVPDRLWKKIIGQKALPMTSGDALADGGREYLWWPEYENVLQMLPPENPNVYERVTRVQAASGIYKAPFLDQDSDEYGGVSVTRNTEGSDANETEADVKQGTITCYPLDAYTELSNILLRRDRVGMEAQISTLFMASLVRRANYEIVHGTGDTGSMALGVRQSDDVNTVARATASQVSWTDLVNLEYAVRNTVRLGAAFCLSDGVMKHLKLKKVADSDSSGERDQRPLFSATTGSGPHDRLDNYPYFVGTDASSLGSNGDTMFGNWRHYRWAWEMEGVVSRSPHYKFKKGVTAYRIDALAGGRPWHPAAFAVLVGTGGS